MRAAMDFGRTFGSGRQRNSHPPGQQSEAQGGGGAGANRGGGAASHAAHPQLNKGAVERWASSGAGPPSPTSLFYQPFRQMTGQPKLESTTPNTQEQNLMAWGASGPAGKEWMQASPSAKFSQGGMGFEEARRRPGGTLRFGSGGVRASSADALNSRESKPPKKEPSEVSPSLQQSGREKLPAWSSGFESDFSTVLDLPRLDKQQSALEQYARNLGMSHGLAQTIPQPSPQPTHPTRDAARSPPRPWPTKNFQISLAATQASAPYSSQALRPAVEQREGGQQRRQGFWTEQGGPSSALQKQPWEERTAEPLLPKGISMFSSQSPIPSARGQLWRNRSGVHEQVAPFDFSSASGNRGKSASKDQGLTSPNTVHFARGVNRVSSTHSWSEQMPNQVQQPTPGHRPDSIYAFPDRPLISGQNMLKSQPLSAQLEQKKSADRPEVLSKDRINDFAKAFSSGSADHALSESGRAGPERQARSPDWGLTLEPLGMARSAERDFLGGSGVPVTESNLPYPNWKTAALEPAPKASGDGLELSLEPSFRGGGKSPQQDIPHGQVLKETTKKHKERQLEKAMEQRPIVARVVGAPEDAEWERRTRFAIEARVLERPLDMEAEDTDGQPSRKRLGAQLQDTRKPLESPAKRLNVSVQQDKAGDGRTSSDRARECQEVGVEQPELNRARLHNQGQATALPRELLHSTRAGNPMTLQDKGQKGPLKESPAQEAQTGPECGPRGSLAWGKMLSELAKKGGNHVGSEMLRTGLFGSLMQGTQFGALAHQDASSDPSEKLPLSSKSVERWVGRAPTLPVYF